MANSKVVFYGETLIDLTGDTVAAAKLLEGITAHDKAGEPITGTCTYDSDTSEDTANADDILFGETAHARGSKVTGTMPNNGSVTGSISTAAGEYTVPMGYHDGGGKVSIAAAEQQKLVAGNIKKDITILGIKGTYGGEAIKAQQKTVTPAKTAQTITPDSGYDYISQVTVNAVPKTETSNSAGGTTVTIGA